MTSPLLTIAERFAAARVIGTLPRIDPRPLDRVSISEWLSRVAPRPAVRHLIGSLVRVSTYTADFERLSAGAAIAQVQMALATGVKYVDGGWQSIVDGLRESGARRGVRFSAGSRVIEVNGETRRVRLADGKTVDADAVVLATGPREAASLVPSATDTLARWAEDAIPVRAACLDLALDGLPRPELRFALGLDRADYFSVHTAYARLAPEHGAVIHVMRYLSESEEDAPKEIAYQLEALLDTMQPGWRERVVARRYMPELTVSNAMVTASSGGLAGRPGPEVPGVDSLFVAGDWVGAEGMLADAALESGRRAAEGALAVCGAARTRVSSRREGRTEAYAV
jgi:phytoene dehydrogenase-like protein